MQDSQLQQSQFDDNLVSLMRSAYEVRNNAQNEILKTIGSPTRKGEINLEKLAKQQERFAKSDYAYNLLSDKVSKRKGNAYQETAVSDIAESSKIESLFYKRILVRCLNKSMIMYHLLKELDVQANNSNQILEKYNLI